MTSDTETERVEIDGPSNAEVDDLFELVMEAFGRRIIEEVKPRSAQFDVANISGTTTIGSTRWHEGNPYHVVLTIGISPCHCGQNGEQVGNA